VTLVASIVVAGTGISDVLRGSTKVGARLSGNLLSARGNWALDPETRRPNPD